MAWSQSQHGRTDSSNRTDALNTIRGSADNFLDALKFFLRRNFSTGCGSRNKTCGAFEGLQEATIVVGGGDVAAEGLPREQQGVGDPVHRVARLLRPFGAWEADFLLGDQLEKAVLAVG